MEFNSEYGTPFKRANSEQEFYEKNFKDTKHEDWANQTYLIDCYGNNVTNSQYQYILDTCLG